MSHPVLLISSGLHLSVLAALATTKFDCEIVIVDQTENYTAPPTPAPPRLTQEITRYYTAAIAWEPEVSPEPRRQKEPFYRGLKRYQKRHR